MTTFGDKIMHRSRSQTYMMELACTQTWYTLRMQ